MMIPNFYHWRYKPLALIDDETLMNDKSMFSIDHSVYLFLL